MTDLAPGDIIWAEFGHGAGREQRGRRPAVVVSSARHLATTRQGLVTIVPCTKVDRQWLHHVAVTGPSQLRVPTFAMTEQVRTISPQRVGPVIGRIDQACRQTIGRALDAWLIRSLPLQR